MPAPLRTFLSTPSEALPSLSAESVNLLPFRLPAAAAGPAPISTYFVPRSPPRPNASSLPSFLDPDDRRVDEPSNAPGGSGSDPKRPPGKIAAFRGRRVQAHTIAVPEGYIGVVLSAPPIPTKSTEDIAPKTPTRGHKRQGSRVEEVRTGWEPDSGTLRRSPRKRKIDELQSAVEKGSGNGRMLTSMLKKVEKKVVKKVSLDSDSDEEEDAMVEASGGSPAEDDESKLEEGTASATASASQLEGSMVMDAKEEDDIPSGSGSIAGGSGVLDVEPSCSQAAPSTTMPTSTLTTLPPSTPAANLMSEPPTPTKRSAFRASPSPPAARERLLVPTKTFTAFTLWAPDGPLAGDGTGDEYVRALDEWIGIGRILHES